MRFLLTLLFPESNKRKEKSHHGEEVREMAEAMHPEK